MTLERGTREQQSPVRSLGVVMASELPKYSLKDSLEMVPAEDQQVVVALPPCRPHPPLGERVRLRSPDRSADDPDALSPEDLVEGTGEFRIPVSDRNRTPRSRSPSARFRACWVTHAESGFLVTPRRCTRLDPSSIAKSTYIVRSQTVPTVKKSMATIP
jgi:hypothetical protein